jgi:hypothetical protein
MTIEVNSAGWTGNEPDDVPATAPQVCGEFHDKDRLDEALSRLEGSAFQRADLSVRVPGREDDRAFSGQEEPMREDDARNLRTLGTSTAAAGLAMGAAGAVIATGGAALPAVAAAAAAGGATLAAGGAAGAAAAPDGATEQQQAAEQGGVVLMVHADTPEKQAKAEEVMRACGATRVWRQDHTR